MKDPKKTSGGKGGPGLGRPQPTPTAPAKAGSAKADSAKAGSVKSDPRAVPAPTAPPSVSAGALNALAAVRESATVEPKRAETPPRAQPAAKQAPKPAAYRSAPKPPETKAVSPPAKPPEVKAPPPQAAKPIAPKAAAPTPGPKPVNAQPAAPSRAPNPTPLRVVGNDQQAPPLRPAADNPPTTAPSSVVNGRDPAEPQAEVSSAPPQADSAAAAGSATAGLLAPGLVDAAGWAELNHKMLNLMKSQTEANLALWRSTLGAGSLSEAIRMQTTGVREAYEATAAQWRDIAETAARLMSGSGAVVKLPWTDQGR